MVGQGFAARQVKLVDANQVEREHCPQGNEGEALGEPSHLRKPGQGHCSFPQEPD